MTSADRFARVLGALARTAAASLLALVATAASGQGGPISQPWREAVVSVRDLSASARLFEEVGNWRRIGEGRMSASELRYWGLSAPASATFRKICPPDTVATGCIRFVRFSGVRQRPIRLASRPWDTGGIFSIMARSTDVRQVFDRAIALGWWAETEPYAFQFNGSDLVNVVLTGPDGVNLALYQRNTPAFTDYRLGLIGRGFNSMRMVRDQRASVAWYRQILGFTQAFDSDFSDPAPGPTNFSIPWNLAPSIVRRASAMHPVTLGWGRIELMQFVGFTGKDVSAHADAPNLGILSLRYPVADITVAEARIAAAGVTPARRSNGVTVAGLGRVDVIAVRDPDGNLTELFAPAR